MPTSGEITRTLVKVRTGDPAAETQLLSLVYKELRDLASQYFREQRSDHTLQPTALVHEAYLKVVESTAQCWDNRAHFFAVAARAMRQILVDHARRRRTAKRGGDRQRVALDEGIDTAHDKDHFLISLDEALVTLAECDPQQRTIVEMRFFGGLTVEETAHVLGISPRSVDRGWSFAKAWLYREMSREA
jgi:RNA polymerase sigma factor (TIGR02999 family)